MKLINIFLILLFTFFNNVSAQEKVEIVLTELSEKLQKYGYGFIYREAKKYSFNSLKDYKKYKGMKGTIVGEKVGPLSTKFYVILLKNGETVYSEIEEQYDPFWISGTYLVSDFNKANELVGKFVWVNKTRYDSHDLVTETGLTHKTANIEKLQVLGVVARSLPTKYIAPFYLKVKKETGEIGYISYKCIYKENPLKKNFNDKIKKLIQQQKISINMTKEQLLLSWGQPRNINESVGSWGVNEQWIYESQYVYIENGVVTSFQSQR